MRIRLILVILSVLLLAGCKNKVACPLCFGIGETTVEGLQVECILCHGECEIDKETLSKYQAALEHLRNSKQGGANVQNSMNNPIDDMVNCPMCSGSGIFSMYGNSQPCSECKQTGKVTSQRAAQLRQGLQQIDQMTGGSGYNNTSIEFNNGNRRNNRSYSESDDLKCHTCNGTGRCGHCAGHGIVEYDDPYGLETGFKRCPICKQSGKCGVCNGRGTIR